MQKAMSIFHLNFIWLKILSGDGTFRHRFFYLNSSLRISSRLLTIAVTISYEPPSEIDFIRAFMFSSKSFGKRVQYFFAELNLSFFTWVCLTIECEDNIKIAFEKSGDSVIDTDDIATLLSLFNLPVI